MKPALTTDPGDAASYAARIARHVPGLHDLHRMAGLLLAEHVPDSDRVLVLGAGGGPDERAVQLRPGPGTVAGRQRDGMGRPGHIPAGEDARDAGFLALACPDLTPHRGLDRRAAGGLGQRAGRFGRDR